MRYAPYALALSLFVAACGGASPTTPTAPGNSSAVTAVTVGAAPNASVANATFQLMANARFGDGTMRDVTSDAKWESSNPALATVSAAGLVAVVGTGDVELRATYQNITGSMHALVGLQPRTTSTLVGTVYEVPPTVKMLADARVQIMSGPDNGKFTSTDRVGNYRLDGLTKGQASVMVTLNGYQSWGVGGLDMTGDQTQQDVWLYPVPPRDASGKPPTARCQDGSWTWTPDPKTGCDGHGGVAYALQPGTDRPARR